MGVFDKKTKAVPPESAMNAVIYARYSSANQTENSIDGQLAECYRFANYHGYTVIGKYIDRAKSATSDDRDDFLRMIDDAKKQQFAYIIVYRFDRFARNRYDSVVYKRKLAESGVRVISTAETIGDGDESIILEALYEAIDESYSRRLSTITKRGMRESIKKGLWITPVPFGYDAVDRRLQINERESEGVKLCFDMYLDGQGKKKIARELNERGYKTKRGNDFTVSSVDNMLRHEIYTGSDTCFDDMQRTAPQIIDRDVYDKARAKMIADAKFYGRKQEQTEFLLVGKLYCGNCGTAMTGDTGTSRSGAKYHYYTCHNRKKRKACSKLSERQDFLEWYICEQTVKYILTPNRIREIAANVEQLAKSELERGELQAAINRQTEINKELDDLCENLIHTKVPQIIKRINDRAELLSKELEATEQQIATLKLQADHVITADAVTKYLSAFSRADLHDIEVRRRIINTLVQAIYLFDDKIVIYFNIKGAKSVTFLEMIRDAERLASECSVSSTSGELI